MLKDSFDTATTSIVGLGLAGELLADDTVTRIARPPVLGFSTVAKHTEDLLAVPELR